MAKFLADTRGNQGAIIKPILMQSIIWNLILQDLKVWQIKLECFVNISDL